MAKTHAQFLTLSFLTISMTGLMVDAAFSAELDGAWTTDKENCNSIFTTSNGKTVFSSQADLYGSGFIIDGTTIRGRAATCKVKSMTKRGDRIHISASCATDIMLSNTEFDLTSGSDGKLTRSFRGMPEMSLDYYRCPAPQGN
jgi:hypothetical protein